NRVTGGSSSALRTMTTASATICFRSRRRRRRISERGALFSGAQAGQTRGGRHECATAFAPDGDVGDGSSRLRATGGARGRARQYWCARVSLYPGFFRHMASRQSSLVHTTGGGSRSGDEPVADEGHRRERLQLARR